MLIHLYFVSHHVFLSLLSPVAFRELRLLHGLVRGSCADPSRPCARSTAPRLHLPDVQITSYTSRFTHGPSPAAPAGQPSALGALDRLNGLRCLLLLCQTCAYCRDRPPNPKPLLRGPRLHRRRCQRPRPSRKPSVALTPEKGSVHVCLHVQVCSNRMDTSVHVCLHVYLQRRRQWLCVRKASLERHAYTGQGLWQCSTQPDLLRRNPTRPLSAAAAEANVCSSCARFSVKKLEDVKPP